MLKGIIASSIIAGGVLTTALVTWDGGSALENAKNKIVEQTNALGVFAGNETKLITKVNTLKGQVSTLQADVAAKQAQIDELIASGGADEAVIASLQADIAAKTTKINELNAQITQLNADLASSDSEGEQLAQRVKDLEAQLNEANDDAADLQATVDATGTTSTSNQSAVDAALADGGTSEPTPDPEPAPETPQYPLFKMIVGTPKIVAPNYVLDKVDNTPNDGVENYELQAINMSMKTWTIVIDGQTVVIPESTTIVLGKASDLEGKTLSTTINGVEYNYILTNQ